MICWDHVPVAPKGACLDFPCSIPRRRNARLESGGRVFLRMVPLEAQLLEELNGRLGVLGNDKRIERRDLHFSSSKQKSQ